MVYLFMWEIELTVDRNFNHFSVPMGKRPWAVNWLGQKVKKVTRVKGRTHWQPEPDSQDCAVYTNLTLSLPTYYANKPSPKYSTSVWAHATHLPPSYIWSPRTPSWDSDALTFPSLRLKLWQVLPGSRPHIHFFSIKNFSWQEFQQFVDRIFRGYHHLSIPGEPSKKKNTETLKKKQKFYLTKKKAPC